MTMEDKIQQKSCNTQRYAREERIVLAAISAVSWRRLGSISPNPISPDLFLIGGPTTTTCFVVFRFFDKLCFIVHQFFLYHFLADRK